MNTLGLLDKVRILWVSDHIRLEGNQDMVQKPIGIMKFPKGLGKVSANLVSQRTG